MMISDREICICDFCGIDQGGFDTETGNHPICAEAAALRARVDELEAALYPFQHPDFTTASGPDTRPMWAFNDAKLDLGDFRRARSLFLQQAQIERVGQEKKNERNCKSG